MQASPPRGTSSHMPSALRRWTAPLLALAWLVAWFFGLGARALGEPDEGRYAEVAREMLASGDWLTPRLNGFDFFDKPALHYWASAAAYSLFGVHEWTARLWCALTGLMAMAAVGWAGARLFGRQAGGFAAVILGSSLLFAAAAHINTLDMAVAAFLAVGMACFMVAQFDPTAAAIRVRLNLLMWTALTLAVLSKGLIGLVIPGMVLFVYMLWQRAWPILGRVSLLQGIVILIVLGAPWFVVMSLRHPGFFDYFFIREHFTRYLSPVDKRQEPIWFFVGVVVLGVFPWTLLLPWRANTRDDTDSGRSAVRFLWLWVALVLLFFSLSHSKLPFYILPVFPALALLIARHAATLPPRHLRWRLLVIALIGAAGAIAAWLAPVRQHGHMTALAFHHTMNALALACVLIALAALGGSWLLTRRKDTGRTLAIHLLALAALCSWQVLLVSLKTMAVSDSAIAVAGIIKPALTPKTEVYTVNLYLRGLPFYLQRLVTVAAFLPDDLRPGLASRPSGYIADLAGFERRWRAGNDEIAVIPTARLELLRQDGLPFRELGRAGKRSVIAHGAGAQAR